MKYQVQFGISLQKLRLERNLSQGELAETSGIDRTFISLLERGIRQPSLTTIFELSRALDIKPSLFMIDVESGLRRSRIRKVKL